MSDFEPFVELQLELATLDRLEILSVRDFVIGGQPPQGAGPHVDTAIGNARLGYALRNREIQVLGQSEFVTRGDPIAELLQERLGEDRMGVRTAVVHGILRDVLFLQIEGGADAAYEAVPGTTPELRRQAIEQWAEQHFAGDHPRIGRQVTRDLLEYGYFLHRLVEI